MGKRIVAMALIPSSSYGAARNRCNLDYARYSQATWSWWCHQHGIEFIVLDKPLGGCAFAHISPTIQRWLAIDNLLNDYGPDATVAIVDADTMIRWDAPNFFELAGAEFAAVRDWLAPWVFRSIRAFQNFFTSVTLTWFDYFNVGLVVLNASHIPLTHALTSFVLNHFGELQPLFDSWEYGDDQTLLNFIVRAYNVPVRFLDPRFNVIHCAPMIPPVAAAERGMDCDRQALLDGLTGENVAFMDMGYVWHFTNVVRARSLLMEAIWRVIQDRYRSPCDDTSPRLAELRLRLAQTM